VYVYSSVQYTTAKGTKWKGMGARESWFLLLCVTPFELEIEPTLPLSFPFPFPIPIFFVRALILKSFSSSSSSFAHSFLPLFESRLLTSNHKFLPSEKTFCVYHSFVIFFFFSCRPRRLFRFQHFRCCNIPIATNCTTAHVSNETQFSSRRHLI